MWQYIMQIKYSLQYKQTYFKCFRNPSNLNFDRYGIRAERQEMTGEGKDKIICFISCEL